MGYFGSIEASNNFDMGGGAIAPIPANTNVLAVIDQASWNSPRDGGPQYIEVRWNVVAPDDYKNRKVFQKIRIEDEDEKKKDKNIRMLLAIDNIAGGKIAAADKRPDDALLATLMGKPMVINIQTWEMDGKEGNWVRAVSARKPVSAPAPVVEAGDEYADVPF